MTTLSIIALTIAVWGQRLIGGFVIGPSLESRPTLAKAASLIPAAVVMAVIVQLTVANGRTLVADERLAGVLVAGVLVWRRAPFLLVVLSAAVTTAILRSFGG